jgi:precorrin isomerase
MSSQEDIFLLMILASHIKNKLKEQEHNTRKCIDVRKTIRRGMRNVLVIGLTATILKEA